MTSPAVSVIVPVYKTADYLITGRKENIDGLDVDFTEGSIRHRDSAADAEGRGFHRAPGRHPERAPLGGQPAGVARCQHHRHAQLAGSDAGVEHVVVASSSSVYGSNPKLPKDKFDWTRPKCGSRTGFQRRQRHGFPQHGLRVASSGGTAGWNMVAALSPTLRRRDRVGPCLGCSAYPRRAQC